MKAHRCTKKRSKSGTTRAFQGGSFRRVTWSYRSTFDLIVPREAPLKVVKTIKDIQSLPLCGGQSAESIIKALRGNDQRLKHYVTGNTS